jgi:hypothetical protein
MSTLSPLQLADTLDPQHGRAARARPPSRATRLASSEDTVHDLPSLPQPVPVPGLGRAIEVKVASEAAEWEQAFRLVLTNYQASGYEEFSTKRVRFTPYHALPDATVFVAREAGRVLATFTLVPDNRLLGLPMEGIYADEIGRLRGSGQRLGEVTSLAMGDMAPRESLQVFVGLIQLMMQYHVRLGGNAWVLAVNPRHHDFYQKVTGCVPLGPCRPYPRVKGYPAEAFLGSLELMRCHAPKMYDRLFTDWLPQAALLPCPMPLELVRQFAGQSSQTTGAEVERIVRQVRRHATLRLW